MSTDSALLVIDAQVGLLELPAYRSEEVVACIAELVARARAANVPVIYMQHDGDEGGRLAVGESGWQIHPAIAPLDQELVIRKRASDSFYETRLQQELHAHGIKHLVITGLRTEMCVDTTCRVAVSRGYDVTLVKDAHTTTASDLLSAEQIVAHHNDTLDDFGNDEHAVAARYASEVAF